MLGRRPSEEKNILNWHRLLSISLATMCTKFIRFSFLALASLSPSDNGVYTLVLTSCIFQISLFLIKKYRYFIKSMFLRVLERNATKYSKKQKSSVKCRLRNKTKNYVGHLQKSIVDNVTNIYGTLFIATFTLISGAFGLYHAWRLSANLEKSAEKLDPAILPPGAFFILAALSSGALIPYFSHALR